MQDKERREGRRGVAAVVCLGEDLGQEWGWLTKLQSKRWGLLGLPQEAVSAEVGKEKVLIESRFNYQSMMARCGSAQLQNSRVQLSSTCYVQNICWPNTG